MGQGAVGVSFDNAIVISHRDMTPLIQWRHESRINPGPTGIAVSKGPLNAAVGKTRNLVLTLFVDQDAAARRIDPGTNSEAAGHQQTWSSAYLHVSTHPVKGHCRATLSGAPGCA